MWEQKRRAQCTLPSPLPIATHLHQLVSAHGRHIPLFLVLANARSFDNFSSTKRFLLFHLVSQYTTDVSFKTLHTLALCEPRFVRVLVVRLLSPFFSSLSSTPYLLLLSHCAFTAMVSEIEAILVEIKFILGIGPWRHIRNRTMPLSLREEDEDDTPVPNILIP